MTSAIFFRSQEQSNMKKLFPNQNLHKIRSKRNSCSNPACTQDRGQRRHEISLKTPIKRSPQSSDFEENLTKTLVPPKVTAASIHFRSCQTNYPQSFPMDHRTHRCLQCRWRTTGGHPHRQRALAEPCHHCQPSLPLTADQDERKRS
jgi:hypothetical protein